MKHLYKTKGGEILEALNTDHKKELVLLQSNKYKNCSMWVELSEVQEVVLDKDGEPLFFDGEWVCVGDETNGKTIKDYMVSGNGVIFVCYEEGGHEWVKYITSHTPKHPQKKGIEKIDLDYFREADKELADKLNELIDEVNKLKE